MTEGATAVTDQAETRLKKRTSQLGWLLVGSFTLTIAVFVAASIVASHRARGIVSAAENVTNVAFPTVSCLATARSDLWRIAARANRLIAPDAEAETLATDLVRLAAEREDLARTWRLCTAIPLYSGEAALQHKITASLAELSTSLDRLVQRVEHGDAKGAAAEVTSTMLPTLDEVGDGLHAEIDLSAQQSAMVGHRIQHLQERAERTQLVLDVLDVFAVVFAITAALTIVRLLREVAMLMEKRILILEQFASSLAHDIRGPLTTVSLTLDRIKRDPRQAEKGVVLDRATQSLQRVLQLVDGLLVFARAGAPPTEGAVAVVREVVAGVLDQMRPLADEKSIELRSEVFDATSVACSPGVLMSIVSNLVANAIKYMGDATNPCVSVQMSDHGKMVCVEVSDTGPGVPTTARPRMFELYMRVGATSGMPGLGLGLATVRRLVEAHGGRVGLRADDPGSTFWFELPKAQAELHGDR